MKTLFTLLLFMISFAVFAQKSDSTIIKSKRIAIDFKQTFTELKNQPGVKNGISKIFFEGDLVAFGLYKNNTRYGRWNFYKKVDELDQLFNYSSNKVEYNSVSKELYYDIDSLVEGDSVINPVKVGGFRIISSILFDQILSKQNNYIFAGKADLFITFSIDENGKLIKIEKQLSLKDQNFKIEKLDVTGIPEEELKFIPAQVNSKKVPSKIILKGFLSLSI